jgi:rhomboid family GlyGly-CTERM serine protease
VAAGVIFGPGDRAGRVGSAVVMLAGLAAGAMLASGWPALAATLVYDRAAILAGQWWRILTGHLVHFTGTHLAADLAGLVVAGGVVARNRRDGIGGLLVFAALGTGLVLLAFEPALVRYGGLSGIVWALIGYLAVDGMVAGGAWRWLCAAALGLLLARLGWEFAGGGGLVVAGHAVVPLAHAAGLVSGMVFHLWQSAGSLLEPVGCREKSAGARNVAQPAFRRSGRRRGLAGGDGGIQ